MPTVKTPSKAGTSPDLGRESLIEALLSIFSPQDGAGQGLTGDQSNPVLALLASLMNSSQGGAIPRSQSPLAGLAQALQGSAGGGAGNAGQR